MELNNNIYYSDLDFTPIPENKEIEPNVGGDYSSAVGMGTKTISDSEVAAGKFNATQEEPKVILSVGIGKSKEERENAITILENGEVYVKGLGGYDGTNLPASSIQDIIGEEVAETVPLEPGDAENSLVQAGSNAAAFGVSSTAFGTSTTNAKERGITEESTLESIITEWAASDPESDKFALTLGEGSHIEGNNCLALGKNSHAEGNGTVASNNSSHAEGTGCIAAGKYAHAEGLETKAVGERSHAEGQETTAEGKQSHAEGKHTYANANGSHAEGLLEPRISRESFSDRIKSAATESTLYQTLDYSTAAEQYEVGYILWKISSDGKTWEDVRSQNIKVVDVYSGGTWFKLSKKLGIGNKSTRYIQVITEETEIYEPQTEGEYSHAEGVSTETKNRGEHAEGKYNKSNNSTISSVGIGVSHEDRKNAFEIMQNGLVFIYGVNGYDGTNIDTSSTGNSLQAGILNNNLTVDGSLFGW